MKRTLPIYQVDAFTDEIFKGNPAAICPLTEWLPDELMQKIAMENNLAETAFVVKNNDRYEIRWFTPAVEVDLCGHATLAAAYVLFEEAGIAGNQVHFFSPRSGSLMVTKDKDWLTLNFPSDSLQKVEITNALASCFDRKIKEAYKGKSDFMLVFDTEDDIRNLKPDFHLIGQLPARGIIVTASGKETDFVSRFFGPAVGINEDPVTGSAHTSLIPYWAKQLNKNELTARQLSERSGYLLCKFRDERVVMSGKGSLYLKGMIYLE